MFCICGNIKVKHEPFFTYNALHSALGGSVSPAAWPIDFTLLLHQRFLNGFFSALGKFYKRKTSMDQKFIVESVIIDGWQLGVSCQ